MKRGSLVAPFPSAAARAVRAPAARASAALFALLLLASAGATAQEPAGDVPGSGATATGSGPTTGASPTLGYAFDLEQWQDMPLGHGLWSPLETVDGTAILDRVGNGGLYTAEPGLLGVHGASWTQVSYRLADLDVTDPDRTGTPLLLPDLWALRSVELVSGLMPAEERGPGAVVRLVPRRAGAAWHGAVGGDFVPAGWQATVPAGPPAVARYASFSSARFRLEGPLVKDRLGLSLSGALTRAARFERADPTRLEGREASLLAHLVWTASPRDEVRFVGAVQGLEHPYGGRALFGPGGARQSDQLLALQTTWERHGSVPWVVSAGYARGAFDPDLAGRTPQGPIERLRDGPVPLLLSGAGTRETTLLKASVNPVEKHFAGGRHALRLGATTTWSQASTTPAGEPGLTPETVGGLAARVWDYGWTGPASRWRAFDLAAYAADAMTYGPASFDLGLRFESTSGSAAAGGGAIDWRDLSPRLSTRIRLTPGGAVTFFGGYARYRHRLPLGLLAYGDPTAAHGAVYRWTDRNGDGAFQADERGPLVALVGPGGSSSAIDPQLKAPHTDEVVTGLEFRFGAWRAHFLGIHRRERDLLASVNVGAPLAAYTVRYVPDPGGDILGPADDQLLPVYDRRPDSFGQDRYLLTNTAENALHEGAEIALERALGGRLRLRLAATAYRSEGPGANRGFAATENDQGLVGERLEDPNATTFARGRLYSDRAFTIKLAGHYDAPGDVRLGLITRYQDGQPFSRLVIAPDLAQGAEAIQAIPNGRSRFTYTLTVDARIEKSVAVGHTRIALVAECFNVLNTANEVEEVVLSGPAFRTIATIQPPRAFRVGALLAF
jgi:hypothetical protein